MNYEPSQKPDIICIVETWLSEDITDNEILQPDYKLHRLDHNRHHGSMVLYPHNSKLYLQGGPHNLEDVSRPVSYLCISF